MLWPFGPLAHLTFYLLYCNSNNNNPHGDDLPQLHRNCEQFGLCVNSKIHWVLPIFHSKKIFNHASSYL